MLTYAYVCHTCRSAAPCPASICQHTSAYVSIRQHTSAYVSIRQRMPHLSQRSAVPRQHMSAYVSIRQHTSAYASVCHTLPPDARMLQLSAYVSIRQHTSAYATPVAAQRRAARRADAAVVQVQRQHLYFCTSKASKMSTCSCQNATPSAASAFVIFYQ
jgi:hypothetical protein